jgi:hypothetical protein
MKRIFRPFAIACVAALSLTACQKDAKEATVDAATTEVSEAALAKIKSLGFDETGARKVKNGYLVEGDILLTEANLNQPSASTHLIVGSEEQYRTTNLVTGLPRVITVSCVGTLTQPYIDATKAMIARYNALANTSAGTRITFQFVSSGGNVNVVGFNEGPSGGFITLGSAGFPTANGDPYNEIRMNTNAQAYGTNPNVDYLTSVLQHEMGHCIGFRHTDYSTRSSCGKRRQNEGTAGVGAVHIPGTPTGADPNSFMLACSNGGDRTFNANDLIAMAYLY